jgi:hypothetical protein
MQERSLIPLQHRIDATTSSEVYQTLAGESCLERIQKLSRAGQASSFWKTFDRNTIVALESCQYLTYCYTAVCQAFQPSFNSIGTSNFDCALMRRANNPNIDIPPACSFKAKTN